jgi:hypothetical protein
MLRLRNILRRLGKKDEIEWFDDKKPILYIEFLDSNGRRRKVEICPITGEATVFNLCENMGLGKSRLMGSIELVDGCWRANCREAKSYLNIKGAIIQMFNDRNNYDESLRAISGG